MKVVIDKFECDNCDKIVYYDQDIAVFMDCAYCGYTDLRYIGSVSFDDSVMTRDAEVPELIEP